MTSTTQQPIDFNKSIMNVVNKKSSDFTLRHTHEQSRTLLEREHAFRRFELDHFTNCQKGVPKAVAESYVESVMSDMGAQRQVDVCRANKVSVLDMESFFQSKGYMSFNATASDKNNAYVELIWFSGVDDRGKVNYLHFKVKCNFELAPSYYAETTTSRGGFFIFGYDIVNTTIKEVPTFGSLECISAVSDYMIWRAIQLLPPSDLQHVMRIT